MTEIELPGVDEVRVVRLQSGDTVVYRCEQHLDDENFDDLGTHLKKVFPDNPVLILDGGASIEVLRKEPNDG